MRDLIPDGLMQDILGMLLSVLYFAISSAAVFIANHFREQARLSLAGRVQTTLDQRGELARLAVNAARNALPHETPEKTFAFASIWLCNAASRIGLDLSEEEAMVYISGAVQDLKDTLLPAQASALPLIQQGADEFGRLPSEGRIAGGSADLDLIAKDFGLNIRPVSVPEPHSIVLR